MALDYKNSLGRYRRYLANLQNQPLWNESFWFGLTITLIITLVLLALRPTLVKIASLMGQKREQKALLSRIDGKITNLGLAETNLNQVKTGLEILDQVLPKTSQWAELTDKLVLITSEVGVEVRNLEIKEVVIQGQPILASASQVEQAQVSTLPDGAQKVIFRLEVTGVYTSLKELLQRIENEGRLMVIDSVKINRLKDGSLNMAIDGTAVYYMPAKEKT